MKLIAAYLVTMSICVALAIYAGNTLANPLTDDFAAKYALGTIEPSTIASDRTITFNQIAERSDRTTAFYRTNVIVDGAQRDSYGVMELTPDGGYTYRGINPASWDLAIAGQLADVGTTVVGLASGFAESNPLGLFTFPLKYGLHKYSESLPLADCVEMRTGMGIFGWGAAAANMATLASAAIPAALVGGIVAGWLMYEPTLQDAPVRCVE